VRRTGGYAGWSRSLLFATLMLPGAAAPARALDISAFYESCFVRTYDATHLTKHPGQRVAAMMAEIIQWEENPFVRITYTLRDGGKYSVGGDCYDAIEGGYLCHLCVDESCETGEQTFKVMLKTKDAIGILNDTTGVTGKSESDATDELKPGGEHASFALARTDYAACSN
jgi:hypothetical protein